MLSPTVTRRLIDRLSEDRDAQCEREQAAAKLAGLSARDRQIAYADRAGQGQRRSRAELHLSVATVKSHVSAMLAELALDNRVQIALLVQDAQRM